MSIETMMEWGILLQLMTRYVDRGHTITLKSDDGYTYIYKDGIQVHKSPGILTLDDLWIAFMENEYRP